MQPPFKFGNLAFPFLVFALGGWTGICAIGLAGCSSFSAALTQGNPSNTSLVGSISGWMLLWGTLWYTLAAIIIMAILLFPPTIIEQRISEGLRIILLIAIPIGWVVLFQYFVASYL